MFKTTKGDNNGLMTYFEVLESCAGAWGSLTLGEVLEIAGDVPGEVRELERRGLLRALPDPGALLPWFRMLAKFRPVSAATFAVRPEPPEPTFLDEAAVLRRFGWSADDLRRAHVALGFPREAKRRVRFNPDVGAEEVLGKFWSDGEVTRWQADRAAAARGLLSSVPS